MPQPDFSILETSAEAAARRLLGCELVRAIDGQELRGIIVETEAYDQTDVASHSYRGKTPRTDVMFGPAGYLYVYFTYGMHHCCNVVVGHEGEGAAVLIRALEPLDGQAVMRRNRKGRNDLTDGPAKLCQAFGIDRQLNGHDLKVEPLRLILNPALSADQIVQTTRIGIKNATDVPWRFYVRDNSFVSRL